MGEKKETGAKDPLKRFKERQKERTRKWEGSVLGQSKKIIKTQREDESAFEKSGANRESEKREK